MDITEKLYFFSPLSKLMEEWKVSYNTDKIIMGGDFNLAPDLWLDVSHQGVSVMIMIKL